jgi:hypothetical protein
MLITLKRKSEKRICTFNKPEEYQPANKDKNPVGAWNMFPVIKKFLHILMNSYISYEGNMRE